MPLAVQRELSDEELAAGLVLIDPILFREYWFVGELTKPLSLEQKLMMGDQSQRVVECTARKTGKTLDLQATVLQDILLNEHEGSGIDEGLFVTPIDKHMQQFVDRLFGQIQTNAIFRSIIKIRRGENMMLESANLRYYFRIEGVQGTDQNMVGIRAKYVRGDELAFGAWVPHNSRIQTALPGCRFKYAGVPNGVRDTPFYHIDKRWEGRLWSRHNYTTFINPIYADPKLKHELLEEYGGAETQGYKTQVLGEWGEEVVSSFPPGSIAVHQLPYFVTKLSGIESAEELRDIALRVHIPSVRCSQFAIGWDWGHSPDPATIFGAYRKKIEEDKWQVYCRIELRRIALPHQIRIIRFLIDRVFEGDFVGLICDDIAAVQAIQDTDRPHAKRYSWAMPSGTTQVDLMPSKKKEGEAFEISDSMAPDDALEVANIRNKEYFIGKIKEWMINACENLQGRKLELGHDDEVEMELGSTTERKTLAGYTIYYGPKNPNIRGGMLDHNRESLQYVCQAIEEGLKLEMEEDQSDELLEVLGWGAGMQSGEWSPPYERS